MEINLNDLLRKYKSHPYEDHSINAPHTGFVHIHVKEGQEVSGPTGKWKHRPGTLLYVLEREGNPKRMTSKYTGFVAELRSHLDGRFVQAGEPIMVIRHRLSRDEIIDRILREVLHIYPAPQRARYFFTPEIGAAIEKAKTKALTIKEGDEILIMSLMKRDTLLSYDGPSGVLYKVYFKHGDLLEQGAPLFGVCAPDRLPFVEKVIQRIRTEWDD
ncbi:MAG: hypothetical protein GXO58_08165 [Thermodesulfobacteria bacterium]|nr:hypothetical protein [Thermodesulfobacteriota bacterium]